MTNAIPKSVTTKKSVKLLSEERSRLKSIRKNFDTAQEFADYLQVDRITIGRIMTIGRGSELNMNKIRQVLKLHHDKG